VPDEFYQAAADAADNQPDGQPDLLRQAGLYDDLRGLIQSRLAGATDAGEKARLNSRWAGLAWRCDQPADCAQALADAGERVSQEEVGRLCPLSPPAAADWAAARTAGGDAGAAAEQAWRDRRWAEAASQYGALAAGQSGAAGRQSRNRTAAARALAALASGHSVSIQPDADLTGWELAAGTAEHEEGGVLRVRGGSKLDLRFAAPLRTPFEVRGAFRISDPSKMNGQLLLAERGSGSIMQSPTRLQGPESGMGEHSHPAWHTFVLQETDQRQTEYLDGGQRGSSSSSVAQPRELWLSILPPGSVYSPADQPPPAETWWQLRDLTLAPADSAPAQGGTP
jgi:hypothetical protein